ncbi:hypothetical protein Salat_0614300 [Sesamum alatum]|uniref:Uncharacterized protein n=1 Tax=Sesamum alatum TaxID=300844 RepID=A0AAE1YQI9_9LAMI|nr:hypothetical protein Salat_0614300 [Sesamum alatum]
MELRGCGNTHFIQAIRGNLVIKGRNTDSHGRPALSFKTIKEIYESRDAKALRQPPEVNSQNVHAGSLFAYEHVKYEVPCFPVVDRTLREIKHETDELVSDSDNGLDSDLDDETTLRQLKERFLKRKREVSYRDQNSNLAYANEKTVEAESDLNEPIINWKSKNSRKLKAKRNCMKGTVVSSFTTAFDIKSETDFVEGLPQVGADLAPVICVKVEVPDADELGCKRKTSSAADSSMGQNEVPSPGEASNGFQKMMVQLEPREPLYSAEQCLKCVTNEISYEHLEDNEPISELDPADSMSGKLETPELFCHESLDLPSFEIEKGIEIRDANSCGRSLSDDQSSDVCMPSRSSSSMEEISVQSSSSGARVPGKAIDCTIGCIGLDHEFDLIHSEDKLMADFPDEQDNCLSTPEKICSSSQKSITLLKIDDNLALTSDNIADEEESLTSTLNDITKNGLNSRSNMENELMKTVKKQGSAASITDAKSQSSREHQTFDSADKVLTPESRQPPERLLSTRKAISPSSQEQLCLAMNSVELLDDVDQHIGSECLFDKQTEKKSSPVRPEFHRARLTIKHGGQGQVGQRKVIISSRDIIKKSKNAKVNLESTRFSRTLPNLGAGCTSIQGCSESAIAFAQRQMQDMESLSVKLMNELKSMKDIVEQKLLYEAYRSASLRSDADEVKSAINSASRMEETARKWLSMMQRDCNRFCKIMKLTPNGVAASKDAGPRERKKIMFADEAGGKLCHIKLFEDGNTSPLSDDVEQ